MPSFVFMLGISIPFSLKAQCAKLTLADKSSSWRHFLRFTLRAAKRSAILYALGIATSNNPEWYFKEMRILGVLQRLAIAYFFASLIEIVYLHCKKYSYVIDDLDDEEIIKISWKNSKWLDTIQYSKIK